MPGLTGRVAPLWRSRRDDRGAVATIVAILLAGGVLLGMGALVIDVGRLYAERAELQNGADAAALAVAQRCALGATSCDPSTASGGTAGSYANNNAKDGTSTVDRVCGKDPGAKLPACPASTGRLTDCPAAPASGTTYVDVHTSTRQTDGTTLLPPTLARALAGNSGYDGTKVGACARATWGGVRAAGGLAMTISYCEWSAATSNGTTYAQPPPYPPNTVPPASAEQVLQIHGSGSTCGGGPSGWDLPGGFGWLDDAGSCTAYVDVNNVYHDNTGVSAGSTCKDVLQADRASRTVVYLPIYDGAGGTGHSGYYHLKGFAAFVVTGYNLPGLSDASWLTGNKPCKGSSKCVYGYFTQGLVPSSGVVGGPQMGASVVELSG